jgi:hypothetical protein
VIRRIPSKEASVAWPSSWIGLRGMVIVHDPSGIHRPTRQAQPVRVAHAFIRHRTRPRLLVMTVPRGILTPSTGSPTHDDMSRSASGLSSYTTSLDAPREKPWREKPCRSEPSFSGFLETVSSGVRQFQLQPKTPRRWSAAASSPGSSVHRSVWTAEIGQLSHQAAPATADPVTETEVKGRRNVVCMTAASYVSAGVLLRSPAGAARKATITSPVGRALADPRQPSPSGPGGRHRGEHHRRFSFTRAVSWSLAAAVLIVLVVIAAVEPTPNGPEPVAPLWLDAIAFATIMAALGAVVALVAVSWAGVWLAATTGAGLFVLTLLCPMSGHHVVGGYTYVQYALSGGLLLASALVLGVCGPSSDPV